MDENIIVAQHTNTNRTWGREYLWSFSTRAVETNLYFCCILIKSFNSRPPYANHKICDLLKNFFCQHYTNLWRCPCKSNKLTELSKFTYEHLEKQPRILEVTFLYSHRKFHRWFLSPIINNPKISHWKNMEQNRIFIENSSISLEHKSNTVNMIRRRNTQRYEKNKRLCHRSESSQFWYIVGDLQNKNPLADFSGQFVYARFSS